MRARGFTLVELVAVIVVIGIVSVTIAFFFTGTVSGYIDTARRMDSATTARIALDRLGRELREAMPMSARVYDANRCIQFLPILASSVYIDFPIATSTITALDFPVPTATPQYAAIYPASSGELYGLTSMKSISSITSSNSLRTITLASAATYLHASPVQRLYIVGNPVSFCLTGTTLVRFTSAVSTATPAVPASGASVLLENVDLASSSFIYTAGNLRANALVTINLAISRVNSGGGTESLRLDHEVWVRNVQ